jgi:hypothetical protein
MQLKQTARDALLKPLQAVSGIVERRHTLPILANVLLEQRDGRLYVTATDLEMQITAHSELAGKEAQAVTVAARKLQDLLRALPEDTTLNVETPDMMPGRRHSRFNLALPPPTIRASARAGPGAGAVAAAARSARPLEIRRIRDGAAGHPLLPQRHVPIDEAAQAIAPTATGWVGEPRDRRRLPAAGGNLPRKTCSSSASWPTSEPGDDRYPHEPGPFRLRQRRAHEQGRRRQVPRFQPRDPDRSKRIELPRTELWRRCGGDAVNEVRGVRRARR